MKTVEFILSVDFEPSPDKADLARFREQLADKLNDLEAATGMLDFIGSVEFTGLELHKPDRRKARKVRGSYDQKA